MTAVEPFSAEGASWITDPAEARRCLATEDLTVLGYIAQASNGTMLCRLGQSVDKLFAVYKPEAGERPLWDFPDGSLYAREVAAHEISAHLCWDVVPPTVVRDGPMGPGSLQLFVPHDPSQHYFSLVEEDHWHVGLARLAMFDMVTNNADRKGGHILRHVATDALYGIDNGLTLHREPKLRTVVWDVVDTPFHPSWQADMTRLAADLSGDGGSLRATLDPLLTPMEIAALARRAVQVSQMAAIPRIHPDDRHYPWPPV